MINQSLAAKIVREFYTIEYDALTSSEKRILGLALAELNQELMLNDYKEIENNA